MTAYRVFALHDHSRLPELNRLYASFRGNYLPVPDAQALWVAGEQGDLFGVERLDPAGPVLTGAAATFPLALCQADAGGEIDVRELAGTVIDKAALGGFGVQDVLISLRLVATARAYNDCCVMAAVVRENDGSLRNIVGGGFLECEAPGWLRAAARAWCPEHLEVVNLVVPPQALARHARRLLDLVRNPTLTRPNRSVLGTKESISIILDIGWLRDETEFLEEMAEGLVLDWATSIPLVRLLGKDGRWTEFRG